MLVLKSAAHRLWFDGPPPSGSSRRILPNPIDLVTAIKSE